jgi:hypothetical protein
VPKVLWDNEATTRGYAGEREMLLDLYKTHSLSELAQMFNCSINSVRDRFAKHALALRDRGGANNLKFTVDQSLIDDVTTYGIAYAAQKRGVTPQTLYTRLYYRKGLKVRQLREAADRIKFEEEEKAKQQKEAE